MLYFDNEYDALTSCKDFLLVRKFGTVLVVYVMLSVPNIATSRNVLTVAIQIVVTKRVCIKSCWFISTKDTGESFILWPLLLLNTHEVLHAMCRWMAEDISESEPSRVGVDILHCIPRDPELYGAWL